MPKITMSHIIPNNFEKMKVNFAFHLFSAEVLRGLFFNNSEISKHWGEPAPTQVFVLMKVKLIEAVTARIPSKGLKVGSPQEKNITDFQEYLNKWEASLGSSKLGFISASNPEGLRVTLDATLGLLKYFNAKLCFKYVLTRRLSQDCIEKLFGVIRQFSGCYDHPTATQFLITVNCLSFCDLVKAPSSGNCAGGLLTSLLPDGSEAKQVDSRRDKGKLEEASEVLKKSKIIPDHVYPEKTSDARLVFYIAGYVSRKTIVKIGCSDCFGELLVLPQKANRDLAVLTYFLIMAASFILRRSCSPLWMPLRSPSRHGSATMNYTKTVWMS
ncbi:uncharacterized protein [Dermacentor andersoni]|uniref:uncharacterized protein n=1 Tax=Dermacentor andersoni TaxID=34620 RepID=UPI003B3B1818